MKKQKKRTTSGFALIGVIVAYLVFVSATIFVIYFMNQRRRAARNLEASRIHLRHRAFSSEDVNGGINSFDVTQKTEGDFKILDVITEQPDDRVRSLRRVGDYPEDAIVSSNREGEDNLDWDSELWQRKSWRRDYRKHTKIYYHFFGYDRN